VKQSSAPLPVGLPVISDSTQAVGRGLDPVQDYADLHVPDHPGLSAGPTSASWPMTAVPAPAHADGRHTRAPGNQARNRLHG
jgi:hypothetical protein